MLSIRSIKNLYMHGGRGSTKFRIHDTRQQMFIRMVGQEVREQEDQEYYEERMP